MSSPFNNSIRTIRITLISCIVVILLISGALILFINPEIITQEIKDDRKGDALDNLWIAPDSLSIPSGELGKQIRYGKELITHTAQYLGPKGSVLQISNGMNCQNCHLYAGTKPFGNNYGSVASLYPKFRARSGSLEGIEKRVNDCFERSLNGMGLDSLSKEMRAMVAYIKWVGKDVPKGKKAIGSGLYDIVYLDRQCDTVKGKSLFQAKCVTCHGANGEGLKRFDGIDYVYPPLWGENSFNNGAGLFCISNFAKYIFANMPQGATYEKPLLNQEESWDIAAYVLSMPRPEKLFVSDWPKIETKPVDHPNGPYADKFSETQHKYGPFKPILESQN
ncbi:MAG: c-type cytochrome [Bacteroidia bacterium]|nr:c-type cytochrome [Bacteroidia bacterium]